MSPRAGSDMWVGIYTYVYTPHVTPAHATFVIPCNEYEKCH